MCAFGTLAAVDLQLQAPAWSHKQGTVRESEAPTLRDLKIPVALVIAGTEEILGAVSSAALSAQVLVAECSVMDATNTAAQMRPLVMVMPDEIYDADPEGFDALARDVRARVLHVATDFDGAALEQELVQLMQEAEYNRPSWIDELKR
jgi:hypothetical protein